MDVTQQPPQPSSQHASTGSRLRARAVRAIDAIEQLVGGVGTAVPALLAWVWLVLVAALSLLGVGLLLLPSALRLVRAVADRERARLARWGSDVVGPPPVPDNLWDAVRDRMVRREAAWAGLHGTVGLFLGLLGIAVPLAALQDVTFPLWWELLPTGQATGSVGLMTATDLRGAGIIAVLGFGWIVLALVGSPWGARAQASAGRRLLGPVPGTDLALRIAQLTATRAAGLDAHLAELRRIERALHDGTQNRLVAVTVLLGAAGRATDRGDTDAAREALAKAQWAAEDALAELRSVARGILPPVLSDRSLADALTGLAATSPVRCTLEIAIPDRCPASLEATAYLVVAEALTNAARHAHADEVRVTVRLDAGQLRVTVADDGRGGADETGGTGLVGLRRRVEAHDGTLTLTSPAGGPTMLEVRLPCGP